MADVINVFRVFVARPLCLSARDGSKGIQYQHTLFKTKPRVRLFRSGVLRHNTSVNSRWWASLYTRTNCSQLESHQKKNDGWRKRQQFFKKVGYGLSNRLTWKRYKHVNHVRMETWPLLKPLCPIVKPNKSTQRLHDNRNLTAVTFMHRWMAWVAMTTQKHKKRRRLSAVF